MAVYTEVSDEELSAFLAAYDIGTVLSYKGIAEGVENTNYFLHTDAAAPSSSRSTRSACARPTCRSSSALMEHLAERGLNCPLPVDNRRGEALGRLAGRPAAIVTFLDGIAVRRPTRAHCDALGRALARLHLAGRDFPMPRPNALVARGLAAAVRRRPRRRPTRSRRASPSAPGASSTSRRALADRPADAASSTPTSSPTTCSSSARDGLGPDRLLFRLHRRARLRPRDLPQRLVLRARRLLQPHQGRRR